MKKVLVVDDNPVILQLVARFLQSGDWSCKVTADENEVEELLSEFMPDTLLLDISLGNDDGRNICQQIKLDPRFAHIRIILFSALSHDAESVADSYADDFLHKPFTAADLLEVLELE